MSKNDTQFRPTRQESRADRTDRAAREILRDETDARQSKTETVESGPACTGKREHKERRRDVRQT